MRKSLVVAATVGLIAVAGPAFAAGPVAGVAGVRTMDLCTSYVVIKSSNTAQYTGTVNGSPIFLPKAGTSLSFPAVDGQTFVLRVNRGGLGPVTQTTVINCP